MRHRRDDVEIIEVLSPDDSWWGSPAGSDAPPPPGSPSRRRLVVPLIAVVLAAAVAIAIASDDASDTAASPSTTSAPADDATRTSRPTPFDAPGSAAPGHFLIDDPNLRPYSADILTRLTEDSLFEIWAIGGGLEPWISLRLDRRGEPPVFVNSSRRLVDGRELIFFFNDTATTEMVIDAGDGLTARIHAVDVADRELIGFVDGLTFEAGAAFGGFDSFHVADRPLATVAIARTRDELLYGPVATEVRSLTADGEIITLHDAPGEVDDRRRTLPYFATGLAQVAGGYTAGTLTENGDAIVIWSVAGHLLSLTGPVTPLELLAITEKVRPTAGSEWEALLYGLHPDYTLAEFTTVAGGTDGDGASWLAGIQLARRDGRATYLWWWTRPDSPDASASVATVADLTVAPTVETVVVSGVTYVFVSVPATDSATSATVRTENGELIEVVLRQPFPDVSVRVGVTRVDLPGTIEITIDGSPSWIF